MVELIYLNFMNNIYNISVEIILHAQSGVGLVIENQARSAFRLPYLIFGTNKYFLFICATQLKRQY